VQPGRGTLKRAVSDASAGDEVILADGTYTGDGVVRATNPEVVFVDKSIRIRALNTGQAVLDGEDAGRVFYIDAPTGSVVLQGLNVTRGHTNSFGAGMYITQGNVTIRDTDIHHHLSDFVSARCLKNSRIDSDWEIKPSCLFSTLDCCCLCTNGDESLLDSLLVST
jgi:hypothetical protein